MPASTPFTPTAAWTLPGSFDPFPSFTTLPSNGYNDGYPREMTLTGANPGPGNPFIHPLLFNSMLPGAGNRIFGAADAVSLLFYGATTSEPMSTDLLKLCPTNLTDNSMAGTINARTHNLVTPLSFDLDRPAPVSYVWDRTVSPFTLNTTVYPPTLVQTNVLQPFDSTREPDDVPHGDAGHE